MSTNETDLREVVRTGLRKCRVEDGSPAPLIREADMLHITHMVTAELLASDAFRALVAEERAEAWDEARKAKPQYLGPDNGHYNDDCAGWEDCHCGSYINPYRDEARGES